MKRNAEVYSSSGTGLEIEIYTPTDFIVIDNYYFVKAANENYNGYDENTINTA